MASPFDSVPACFAQVVAQHAGRLAVSAPAGDWTYEEFDRRSNSIASQILTRLGENSEPVALLLKHDAPLIAAIFGALKASKMYVAFEPAHPPELLSAMLESSGARLLLTDKDNLPLATSIASNKTTILSVSEIPSDETSKTTFPNINGDSSAWLNFTSGSTGVPKGAWQNHRGLVQEGRAYAELVHLTPDDRVSLLVSCSLAASGSSLFGALLSGASLCLFHPRSQGVERLATWLAEKRISVFHAVPTVFRHLGQLLTKPNSFPAMRLVRLGGEPAVATDWELFRRYWPERCQLIQSLSSTETGIICASIIGKGSVLPNGRLSVGKPITGVEIFLLDDNNQPVKNGGEGKIVIRSPRLKQGYWQQPELTREKFQADESNPNLRTFISNDLGRLLPDGSLEHLGRADSLIKIRGQRVDLAEVENTLLAAGFAHELAVNAFEDKPGEKRLACFFVPLAGVDSSPENLRRLLHPKMPGYMIPADFVVMEKLPQTAGGKIDRAALPPPLRKAKTASGRDTRSRDVIDKRLMGVWETTLKILPIGLKDDFFELGGTSLQSVEILLQIEELFGVSLPPATLVEYNTIEKLSALLANRGVMSSPGVLVKLRDGHGRPLFLIHSGQGDVASYGLLARRLPARPIFGLQSPGLQGESWPLPDVPAMARRYLPKILSQDPTGPYFLAGTCMGGMVAYELAQMLIRQGKTVAFLGLLDAPYPLPKTWQEPLPDKIYYTISTPLRDAVQALRWRTIRALGWGQRDSLLPAYRRFVSRSNGRALRRYRPKDYPGKLTLFLTTDTEFDREDTRLMILPMVRSHEIFKIPGERLALFRKPAVDQLARKLERALAAAENPTVEPQPAAA
jgi:amino acid adenylation domain-containing protein